MGGEDERSTCVRDELGNERRPRGRETSRLVGGRGSRSGGGSLRRRDGLGREEEEELGDQEVSVDRGETEGVGILIAQHFLYLRFTHWLFFSFLGSHFLAALLAAPPVLVLLIWERPHPSPRRSFVLVSPRPCTVSAVDRHTRASPFTSILRTTYQPGSTGWLWVLS